MKCAGFSKLPATEDVMEGEVEVEVEVEGQGAVLLRKGQREKEARYSDNF